MEEYQNIGLMHHDLVNGRVKVLESHLALASFQLDGAQIRKGTWLLAVHVLDDEAWGQIKVGALTGFFDWRKCGRKFSIGCDAE